MNEAQEVIKAIGREHLASRLGVTVSSVREAGRKGEFPANWFAVVRAEAEAINVEIADDLFAFRTPPAAAETAR